MQRKYILFLLVLIMGLSIAGCVDRETEAKNIAIEMAERFAGYNIKKDARDLETEEIGVSLEETLYKVTGRIKRDSDGKRLNLVVVLEDLGDDGWRLDYLSIDSKRLYER